MGKLNTNDAVGNVLHGAVYVAVYRVVRRAEDEAAKEDPLHPALDDLLRPIEAEA